MGALHKHVNHACLVVNTSLFILGVIFSNSGSAMERGVQADQDQINNKALGPNHSQVKINNPSLLVEKADRFEQAGKLEDALILYQKARTWYEVNSEEVTPEYGYILFSLGDLTFRLGDYSLSKQFFEQELEISKKVHGIQHSDNAITLTMLGKTYEELNMLAAAQDAYEHALTIEEINSAPNSKVVNTLWNLGSISYQLQEYAKAEAFIRQILNLIEKDNRKSSADFPASLNLLGLVLDEGPGSDSEAESLFKHSIEITRNNTGQDKTILHSALYNLSNLYTDNDLLHKAVPLLEEAMEIGKGLDNDSHSYLISNNLAIIYRRLGFYEKAESLYLVSLSEREELFGLNSEAVQRTVNNLGVLYLYLGSMSKAENMLLRSLEISKTIFQGDDSRFPLELANLGDFYLNNGDFEKSEYFLVRALSSYSHSSLAVSRESATAHDNLSSLYQKLGRIEEAEKQILIALNILRQSVGLKSITASTTLNNLAYLYESQNLYEAALPHFRDSLEIQFEYARRIAPLFSRSRRDRVVNNLLTTYARSFLYADKGNDGAKLALFARLNRQGLIEDIERLQARLISMSDVDRKLVDHLRNIYEMMSSLEIEDTERELLTEQQNAVEQKIYRLLPELEPRLVKVEDIAKALPLDSVLIEFQRTNLNSNDSQDSSHETYIALVLFPDGKISITNVGNAEEIETLISQTNAAIESRSPDSSDLLAKVGHLVIDPLIDAVDGSKSWFISPDAELNRLPFAALPAVSRSDRYLSDVVNLRLLTTGREILDLQKPAKQSKTDVMIIADPDYEFISNRIKDDYGLTTGLVKNIINGKSEELQIQMQWGRLEATAREGKAIQKLIGGKLWMREEATSELVKRSQAPKVLHLATHAFYLPNKEEQAPAKALRDLSYQHGGESSLRTKSLQTNSPLLRSGIAFAGANNPQTDPNDDGYLTALEVAQLDLDGTDLVVISACESGLGDIHAGEGVYGLKRSISVAGARSSLLSLWKVDDTATAAFMTSFYKRLKSGEGRADALASTQAVFRNHPIPLWREPYVWAAFQLSGDWGPIKFH